MDFYTSIANNYEYIFPYKRFKVDFIDSFLKRGSNVIDIGCAIGDISNGLAEKGHKVLGIDLDKKMIDIARKRHSSDNSPVFKVMDMTRIPSNLIFDSVVSTGNTLVHLGSFEKIESFFGSLKNNLVANGIIIFQILNYEYILNEKIGELPVIENDVIRFKRKYEFEQGKMFFRTELLIKGEDRKIENRISLYPLKKDEIQMIFKETGYKELKFFSDLKGSKYKKDSLPLVFKAVNNSD